MKKLIKNTFIIIASFIALDYVIGLALDMTLKNSPDGRFYKIQYTLKECEEDIIIYGSSRAESNYVPRIFEESLGLTCWNSGRGGQSLPFMYAMNEGVTNRHSPKIAIINVEDIFLEYTEEEYSFFDRAAGILRPFYIKHPAVRSIVDRNSYAEPFLNYSKLYAYNSSYYYLFRPYAIEGLDGKLEDDGWKPKHGKLKDENYEQRVVQEKNELNPEYVALFDNFISSLREKGTQVFVITSPNYKEKVISTKTIEYLKNRKDIVFIDYLNDTRFTRNKTFYNDPNHMNLIGAEAFSTDIANKIKSQATYLSASKPLF